MTEHLIPVTVIGSWSFPGWFEKFDADVKAHAELFGAADRDEAVRDAVRLAVTTSSRRSDRITDGEMQRVDFNLGFISISGDLSRSLHLGSGGAAHDQRDKFRATQPLICAGWARHGRRVSPAPRIHDRAGQSAGAGPVHARRPHRRRSCLRPARRPSPTP